MSGTRPELAARYRRLLLGYPRDYRRRRGDEIVNTFLEFAPPDRTHPTLREAVNLLRHGLRCRLGRPASRTVVVWATLTAIVWGLFTAAFATRVAWETAQPLPDPAEATPLFAQALPDHDLTGKIETSPAMFVMYGQPFGPESLHSLLFGDGGEYGFGATSVSLETPFAAAPELNRTVRDVTARLRGSGWDVAKPVVMNDPVNCGSCDPATTTTMVMLSARRGVDIIDLHLIAQPGAPTGDPKAGADGYRAATQLNVTLNRATPWAVYPAGVVGGLIGSLAGWLLFGLASRRIEGRHAGLRVLTGFLYGMAMFLWAVPMSFAAPLMLWHHLGEQHFRWHPLWEWLYQPVASLPFLVGLGLALIALAVAALPRPRPSDATDAVSLA